MGWRNEVEEYVAGCGCCGNGAARRDRAEPGRINGVSAGTLHLTQVLKPIVVGANGYVDVGRCEDGLTLVVVNTRESGIDRSQTVSPAGDSSRELATTLGLEEARLNAGAPAQKKCLT